jgi:aspartate aminotransferase-like enzyme
VESPPPFGRFFLPGPTEVRPEILAEMARPMIGHRTREARELYAEIQRGLRPLFHTDRPIAMAVSSATGMMEAGVRALPEGRVLALVNGAFSERFARIAGACGLGVDEFAVPWGRVHDPDDVARRLRATRYVGLLCVHSETSTGALQPVRELAAAAQAAGVPILVDAVSSWLTTALEPEAWGIDFALASSQKALALPPGLSFAYASEAFEKGAAGAQRRGLYMDVVDLLANARDADTSFTPALSLLFALRAQLARVHAETLAVRSARHLAMAELCWGWASDVRPPLGVMAPPGFRSSSVTCLTLPEGVRGPELVDRVAARGFVVGTGYGRLRDTTFRIGHMGDHTVEELEVALAACGEALAELRPAAPSK